MIAFVGSVFSPYYAWAGRRDPHDHCAVNVALYGPRGAAWTMTERGRGALRRGADRLEIGRSAATWSGAGLTLDIDERAAPWPRRVRGRIEVRAEAVNPTGFTLDAAGGHVWRPILPAAEVLVAMEAPALRWRGHGYFDHNAGDEPLEAGFSRWTWSRAATRRGATVLYDAAPRRGPKTSLALGFAAGGGIEPLEPPPPAALPPTRWRIPRATRSDDGRAEAVRGFEDAPFYARSVVAHRLHGEAVRSVHESLSLDRFANPVVRLMLPFRMPRW